MSANKDEINILIVTHGGVIMELNNIIDQLKDPFNHEDKYNNNESRYCSVTKI